MVSVGARKGIKGEEGRSSLGGSVFRSSPEGCVRATVFVAAFSSPCVIHVRAVVADGPAQALASARGSCGSPCTGLPFRPSCDRSSGRRLVACVPWWSPSVGGVGRASWIKQAVGRSRFESQRFAAGLVAGEQVFGSNGNSLSAKTSQGFATAHRHLCNPFRACRNAIPYRSLCVL